MKPFWRYYGGKWRAAPRYPKPEHSTIVEPFAGSAGYALRYPDHRVILVDANPIIAGIWRYLISVSPGEIRAIPYAESVDDLPGWVPQEARWLFGFWLNSATTYPRKTLSSGRRALAMAGRKLEGWTDATKERIASQVEQIRHWTIIEGTYNQSPNVEASWFVDPPYNNRAGSYYYGARTLDYQALGSWCMRLRGQAIVCENEGATWLPFRPFATLKAGVNGEGSREAVWTNDAPGLALAGLSKMLRATLAG